MNKDELITSLRGLADGVKDNLREAARTCAVCRCRLWNGSTIDGTRCGVFVACIGVAEGANTEKFDRALASIPRPACDSSSAAMTRSGVAGS